MTGETKTEGQRRPASVRGNRHRRPQAASGFARSNGHAVDDPHAAALERHRFAHGDARLEQCAGGDGLLEQQPVQIAAEDRPPAQTIRVAAFNRDASFTGHQHARHVEPDAVKGTAELKAAQERQAAGVQRVATQLVAWEGRAIEHADARARTREHRGGDGAGRPRSDDQHVTHGNSHHEDTKSTKTFFQRALRDFVTSW